MTWREFANEVPTEPKSVVTYKWEDAPLGGRVEEWDFWEVTGPGVWCTFEGRGAELGRWPSCTAHTHWRYIDPPGTESALATNPIKDPPDRERGDQLEYAARDPEGLDKLGGYYTRHMLAMTREDLHEKSEIAEELAWRDSIIDTYRCRLALAATALDSYSQAHPLAPFLSVLLATWTDLHRPSTDPGEIGSRNALRSLVAGVARFLKVEMVKGPVT